MEKCGVLVKHASCVFRKRRGQQGYVGQPQQSEPNPSWFCCKAFVACGMCVPQTRSTWNHVLNTAVFSVHARSPSSLV